MSELWHRIFVILRAAERGRVGKGPGASPVSVYEVVDHGSAGSS